MRHYPIICGYTSPVDQGRSNFYVYFVMAFLFTRSKQLVMCTVTQHEQEQRNKRKKSKNEM